MSGSPIDTIWLLLCCVLVFTMQCGFLCLESGVSRAKNNINVASKNLIDFVLSVLIFWLLGSFLIFARPIDLTAEQISFLIYQSLFCGTTTTIVSGAVAERMRFLAYLMVCLALASVIYVVIGQWVWGGALDASHSGWLEKSGYVDFAGASVVHMTGGLVALGILIRLGPRMGRYDHLGLARYIPGSDMTDAMRGIFMIWIGWLGFNGGAFFGFHALVPSVLLNTLLGGTAGVVSTVAVGWIIYRIPRIEFMLIGALSGLVSVTAGAHSFSFLEAILVGAIGGVLALAADTFLIKRQVDDVISAVPAHGIAGIWGVLCVGFFGDLSILGTGLGRMDQILMQLLGASCIGLFAFVSGFLLALIIEKTVGLRVTPEQEHAGLNWSEHRVTTAINELYHDMSHLYITKDFGHRIRSEPNTVAGDIAAVFNRILERFQYEQSRAARLRIQAESAAEAKSNFLAIMSHEIRTPMNGILGMVEMLRESMISQEQKEYLDTIHDSGEALLLIINDVLDYSRIESGKMTYEKIEFNLYSLCQQIIQLFTHLAKEKSIALTFAVDDIPMKRLGDPTRIRQILTNLVGNAIKFTDVGSVHLKVVEEIEGHVRFTVQDTGIGIDQSKIKHLFKEFTQADSSISRRYGGTGLGLAICKNLIEGMSGNLVVDSQPGEGSTFSFSLPLEAQLDEDSELKPSEAVDIIETLKQSFKGRKVLVVDDNVVNRTVATKMLQHFDLNVSVCESGEDCLQQIDAQHYDFLLMDMQMPGLDGIETTRLIRQNPRHRHLPIIAVTASSLAEIKETWTQAGVTDYLIKPLRKSELIDALLKIEINMDQLDDSAA